MARPKALSLIMFVPIILGLFFISKIPRETIVKGGSTLVGQTSSKLSLPHSKSLAQPPEIIKAVYLTSYSAGSKEKSDYLISLASTTEINAAVIDIKDYSGYLAYDTNVPEVEQYLAEKIKISDIDGLVEKLHSQNIYAIARITVFQDPILAKARPDLAIKSSSTAAAWKDKNGLAWLDPSSRESWDYTVAIAKDALSHGFDEVNFDYVRFPSDGDLKDMVFPFWDTSTTREAVLRNFFRYLRARLGGAKLSVDLFGLSAIRTDDLGIGQILEDGYEYFDYVSPMVYPSHYATGFLDYLNPNEHPYEIVKNSMESAVKRLRASQNAAKLRPWLQDFNLGVDYNAAMVKKEINAVKDALGENYSGYMLWSPSNVYTKGALVP